MAPFSTYTSSFPSYQQQSITIHTESLFFDPLMFSLFSSDQNVGRWWKSPIWHQQIFRNPEERPPVSGNVICIFICIRYMEDAKPRHLLLMRDHCIWKFLSWSENFSLPTSIHIHLTILISTRWSATTFSFLTGQVSLPCSMLFRTQLLYNLPDIIKDTSLLVSSGTSCLNLFQPIQGQNSNWMMEKSNSTPANI